MDPSPKPSDRTIVVGVDGSAAAARALHWAALEAVRTAATLRITNVWSVPMTTWAGLVSAVYLDPADLEEGSGRIVDRARMAVHRDLDADAPPIETRTVQGGAAHQLLEAAQDASLLVLGSRGRGGFTDLVLGSVAATCAHHSPVPLAVVGVDAPDPGSGDVVVGLDDSLGARTALRWAVGEAGRLGATVRAVHGWDLPVAAPAGAPTFGPLDDPDFSDPTRAALEQIVAEETADQTDLPPITVVAVPQSVPEVLIHEAKSAALLVVGSRGRGGFLGLLLGSVSQQCMHHSPCPVVIVPAPASRPEA